jgi:hypothetical protein
VSFGLSAGCPRGDLGKTISTRVCLDVYRLSWKNLRFIISALVFARNAAPERAATEDCVMLSRTAAGASKNL